MSAGLAFATVEELQALLEAGTVSAVELAGYFDDRLARHGDTFRAVVLRSPDRALRAARRADRRRANGERGPLLGIPHGAKDIFSTRGLPTRAGTDAHLPAEDRDANAIRRLDRAGAGLAAKLALVELVGLLTRRPWSSPQGAALSPWDLSRWAGGSSGGSGAAVAAGLIPFALGSETAGSVGSPAAWCGITGFRPTYGLVGRGGMTPLSPSLDKPGILARSARDCADVLAVLAGRDSADPATRRRGLASFHGAGEDLDARRIRIGITATDIDRTAPPVTRAALWRGIEALRDIGVQRVAVGLPEAFDYRGILDAIMQYEGTAAFAGLVASGEVERVSDPVTRTAIRTPPIGEDAYRSARTSQAALGRALEATFEACDVLVTYNFVHPRPMPPADEEFGVIPIDGGITAAVWAGNLAGLPAAFLPVGLGDDGHPVSLQIMGPPGSDGRVLALAAALQDHTDWHRIIPPHAPPA